MNMHSNIIDNFHDGHFALTEPIPVETEDNSFFIKTQIAMTEKGGRCMLLAMEDCNGVIQYVEMETLLKSLMSVFPDALGTVMQGLVDVGMAEEYIPETYLR